MSHFGRIVRKVIDESNIVLEILDARFVEETRNKELEAMVKRRGSLLVTVINKCDYVDQKKLIPLKKQLENCIFVSAKNHLGTTILKQKINMFAKMHKIKRSIIGVVGYPNVGKSSIINALKGKKSAKISPEAGCTKGKQFIRISEDIMMIDTPGVIDAVKTPEEDLVFVGAKSPSQVTEPDLAVIDLIKSCPGIVEKHYKVAHRHDKEEIIGEIAIKFNLKRKGNLPDIERASRKILIDWQSGKIRN